MSEKGKLGGYMGERMICKDKLVEMYVNGGKVSGWMGE